MSFERLDRPERRWPELSEVEQKLYGIVVPENKKNAIRLEEFTDLYGQMAVAADAEEVRKYEERFRREQETEPEAALWAKRGALFEAMVNDQIESSEWFGENAKVIVPSRFDDIVHGVDGIVEFSEGQGRSHLALAVDITKSAAHLSEKFHGIKSSIEKGELSRVKYFRSEDAHFRGELRRVPRVVIGADQKTMDEVSKLLLVFKTRQRHPILGEKSSLDKEMAAEKMVEFRDARERLANHPLQFQLLVQMKLQLEAFRDYAKGIGKMELVSTYERILGTVDRVFNEKMKTKHSAEIEAAIKDDAVHQMIAERAAGFPR